MKKYLLLIIGLLFLLLVSCKNRGTNNTKCIEFLGIPIEGNVDDFGQKVSKQGYRYGGDDNSYDYLYFDGIYRNKYAQVHLGYNEQNRNIVYVNVFFTPDDHPQFNELLLEYVDRYGEFKFVSTGYSSQYDWKVDNGTFRLESFGDHYFSMQWVIEE